MSGPSQGCVCSSHTGYTRNLSMLLLNFSTLPVLATFLSATLLALPLQALAPRDYGSSARPS
jgi:hypothetical protein